MKQHINEKKNVITKYILWGLPLIKEGLKTM